MVYFKGYDIVFVGQNENQDYPELKFNLIAAFEIISDVNVNGKT